MSDLLFESPIAISLESLLERGISAVKPAILEALRVDDFSKALKLANEDYAASGPKDLDAALTYAILLSHRGLGEEALGVLRKTIQFHADAPALQLAQADALIAKDDFESATSLLEGLTHITNPDPRQLAYLGDLLMEVDKPTMALEIYERSLDLGYLDAGVAISVANIYRDEDQNYEAAEAFEMAGRIAPNDPYIWANAADAWMAANEFPNAIKAYRRATNLDPDLDRAWTYLAFAYLEVEDPEQALRAFKRASRLDPDNLGIMVNIGHTYLELGQPDEARQQYERVMQIEPDQLDAIHGLTAAAFELGDVEMAERMALAGVAADPGNPDAHYNLGVILLALHRTQQALDAFEMALEIADHDPRYLLSAAVATARLGDVDGAMEMAIEASSFLHDDATPAFEFLRDVISLLNTQNVLDFLESVEVQDRRWEAVAPIFEYLTHALRRSDEGQDQRVDAFVAAVSQYPELVPVFWDFEEIERLTLGLEDRQSDVVETMIAVLEGRKELDSLVKK